MIRFAQVIGAVPDKLDFYKAIHADDYAGVRALLKQHNIQNFSIFLTKLEDGKDYLFSYFEYTGEDYARDSAELAANPDYAAWGEITRTCQLPLRDFESWKPMEKVFYLA